MIEVENYKLDYLQDDWGNKDSTFINQAFFLPNNLAQLADNFVLSNEEKNLVNRFEKNSVFEYNLSSRVPSPWLLSLSSCYDIQTNAALE